MIFAPGAHLNPCFTLAFGILGMDPWRFVPVRLLGQFIGSLAGHALMYASFEPTVVFGTIKLFDTKTTANMALFSVNVPPDYFSNGILFWNSFLWTHILIIGIVMVIINP